MLILVLKEIVHRKTHFFLSALSVIVAVALFVSCFTMGTASKHETSRLMREMGFNLRIIPKDTDMANFIEKLRGNHSLFFGQQMDTA